jgi:hypothetical protein
MTADLSDRLRTLGEAGEDTPPPTDDLIRRGKRLVRTRRMAGAGAVLTIAAAAATLTLVGQHPWSKPSAPTAAASSAGPVSLALAAQTSEQTAHRVTVKVRYNQGDLQGLDFEGGYDPATGNAYIRDLGRLKFTEERQIGNVCWINSGGHWQRTQGLCFRGNIGTQAGYFRDPLGLLDELKTEGDATYAGRSNGVDTWTFTSEDRRDHATLHYTGTVKVDVATSRVLSLEFTESVPGEAVTSTIAASYHDYGKPVVVTAP